MTAIIQLSLYRLELGPDAGRVGMFLFDGGGAYADIGFDSYQYDINQFKERLYGLRRIERTPSGDINIGKGFTKLYAVALVKYNHWK